ncbi:MAG: hypothetical protein ACJ79R_08740 [Anaeromyxobacteraceae bacterium]
MKRRVWVGVAGIAGIGAAAAVLLSADESERAQEGAGAATARGALVPPEVPAAPSLPQGPLQPTHLQLPPDVVARDLPAALAACPEFDAIDPGVAPVLTLDLEARDGEGLAVIGAEVARRGGASEALVECMTQVLVGRRLAIGSFSAGEHFLARYEAKPLARAVAPPPQAAALPREPAPPPPPPAVTRQPFRRRGGSR